LAPPGAARAHNNHHFQALRIDGLTAELTGTVLGNDSIHTLSHTFKTFLFACALILVTVGCGKEESVDTGALSAAFAGAPPEIRELVDQAVAAIHANDYKNAISLLDTVLTKSNELGQMQMDAAGQAFVPANVILRERGVALGAAGAKAKAAEIEARSKSASSETAF
jgi:hypothetical protein